MFVLPGKRNDVSIEIDSLYRERLRLTTTAPAYELKKKVVKKGEMGKKKLIMRIL